MSRTAQLITAASTFSVALGIGFVMQNGDALAGRFTDNGAAPQIAGAVRDQTADPGAAGSLPVDPLLLAAVAAPVRAVAPQAVPAAPVVVAVALPEDTVAPSFAADEVILAAAEMPGTFNDLLLAEPADPIGAASACDATLTAANIPAAMVSLTLSAPCSPDAAVVINHQGLMFTILTDAGGQAQVLVPALAEVAVFVADLPGGTVAAASVMVPDMAGYDRAVLQWQGLDGLQLHALEYGASYAGEGHVWSGAARDAALALAGAGGFMTQLGDPRAAAARLAEVYTFPVAAALRNGTVDLSVEAEVTPGNCGRDVVAQSIQISPGQDPAVVDLTMTMPDCAAVGEFLVLDNMLQDLTVAAR